MFMHGPWVLSHFSPHQGDLWIWVGHTIPHRWDMTKREHLFTQILTQQLKNADPFRKSRYKNLDVQSIPLWNNLKLEVISHSEKLFWWIFNGMASLPIPFAFTENGLMHSVEKDKGNEKGIYFHSQQNVNTINLCQVYIRKMYQRNSYYNM